MAEVPITREFLRHYYASHPAPPVPDALCRLLEESRDWIHVCSDSSEQAREIAERWIREPPKRIDENLFRIREQCETVLSEILGQAQLDSIYSVLEDSGSGQIVEKIRVFTQRLYDRVEKHQVDTVARVEAEVSKLLPDDWRIRMVKSRRQKKEKQMREAVEELMRGGASIAEKYNLLWKQQMERREQLVSLGNASGFMKWILKTFGGVPQVLLDFVKTINDEEGPLDETRQKYGPHLLEIFRASNVFRVLLTISTNPLVNFGESKERGAALSTCLELVECLYRCSDEYLTFLNSVLTNSPFFLSKSDALASSIADSRDAPMRDLVVHSREKVEIPFLVADSETVLSYEFTSLNHDIAFGLLYYGAMEEDDDKNFDANGVDQPSSSSQSITPQEILPITRCHSHKQRISNELLLENVGRYAVVFDNTFSMFRKKELSYRISVIRPSRTDIESDASSSVGGSTDYLLSGV